MTLKEDNKYSDIINLPYHVSKKYPRMSIEMRAAQFAPFSALTGYSDEITETARLTDKENKMSEDMKSIIDMKLQIIDEHIKELPKIKVIYFVKDKLKTGGKYIEHIGNLKRIDKVHQELIFSDKFKINISNIYDIQTELLKILD